MLVGNLFGCFWLPIWMFLCSLSLQQDETFAFVNPPPSESSIEDPVYRVGDPINIQWVGTNTFVSVRLVHWLPDPTVDEFVYVFENVTNLGGHFTWVIDLGGMNLTVSDKFFFNIFIEGELSPRAMSHNVTLADRSTSTSSAPTSTHTTSSTSGTTTSKGPVITAPMPTATSPAPAASTDSSSGLSSGAKAGVGVGVAIGALAIIAAGIFFWRRSRAGNVAAGGTGVGVSGAGHGASPNYQPVSQHPHAEHYKPPASAQYPVSEAPTHTAPSELSGSGPTAHEMADTSRP